jgi:branched-chain amino acid transport system ATP-binding protein
MSDGLTLTGVVVARGNRDVVRDVSIEIAPGEVTALLGPNGAGKSSMVLAVGGVLAMKAGSVKLGDRELAGRRPERIRRAGLAIVPEGRRLLGDLTVEDNLKVATYSLSGKSGAAGRKRALEMFPELQKRLGNQASALSGGEQQMVVLAQALVSEPKFVIIDELSLGLAPVVVQRLIPTIRSLTDSGIGVLLIEQFAAVALGLANRAYVMEGGRVQYSGTAQELRDKPAAALRLPPARRPRHPRRPPRPQREPARKRMSGGPGVSALDHVLVLSDDIERSREFYEGALGLRTGDRPPLEFDGFWLYAGERCCLHVADRVSYRAHAHALGLTVPERPGGPGPVDHVAFIAADYDTVCARLAGCGVEPVRNDVPGGGPRQLFFSDPDGARVEINVPGGGR